MPSITSGIKCSDVERRLIAPPPETAGFGIKIRSEIADFEHANWRLITETLTIKINRERQYERDSRIKNINYKMTGMKHQYHKDISKNIKHIS